MNVDNGWRIVTARKAGGLWFSDSHSNGQLYKMESAEIVWNELQPITPNSALRVTQEK